MQSTSFASRVTTCVAALAAAGAFTACGNSGVSSVPPQAAEASEPPAGEPLAALESLDGQSTSVTLDGAFVEALGAEGVTPEVAGDARFARGKLRFPITGGEVRYFDPSGDVRPFVQGKVLHEGSGVTFARGDTMVQLDGLVVDPEASVLTGRVAVDGEPAGDAAPLFLLDGRTLKPLRTVPDGRAVLEGATVKLTVEAAELLNQAFGSTALKGGMVVGTAKLTLAGDPASGG